MASKKKRKQPAKKKVTGARGQAARQQEKQTDSRGVAGIVIFCLGLLGFFCQFLPNNGVILDFCMHLIRGLGGRLCLLLPLFLCGLGAGLVFFREHRLAARTLIGSLIIFFLVLTMIQLFSTENLLQVMTVNGKDTGYLSYLAQAYTADSLAHQGGGLLGALLAWPLHKALGVVGAAIVLVFGIIIALMVMTGVSFGDFGVHISEWTDDFRESFGQWKEERQGRKEQREEERLSREEERALARQEKRAREEAADQDFEMPEHPDWENASDEPEAVPVQKPARKGKKAKQTAEPSPVPSPVQEIREMEIPAPKKKMPLSPVNLGRTSSPRLTSVQGRIPVPRDHQLYIEEEDFQRSSLEDEKPQGRGFTAEEAEEAFLHGMNQQVVSLHAEQEPEKPKYAAPGYTGPSQQVLGVPVPGTVPAAAAAAGTAAAVLQENAYDQGTPAEPTEAYVQRSSPIQVQAEDVISSQPAVTVQAEEEPEIHSSAVQAEVMPVQAVQNVQTEGGGGPQRRRNRRVPAEPVNVIQQTVPAEMGPTTQTEGPIREIRIPLEPIPGSVPSSIPASGQGVRRVQSTSEPDKTIVQLRENRLDGTPLVVPPKDRHDEAVAPVKQEYQFPPLDLLKEGQSNQDPHQQEKDEQGQAKLLETLKNFGVDARPLGYTHGPAITRYEIQPAPGVKVSRIVNLVDDIALNMASDGVRIEAPIPGKAAVGIEVPNKKISMVSLREVLETPEMNKEQSPTAVALGKGISGAPVIADMAKMPHVLIAGATGSGKSVCINTIINSIIFRASPEDVRLILVDPKVVELSVYNGIPHLLVPVVTDPKKASAALDWAVVEMEHRYKRFESMGVRDIKGYNAAIGPGETKMYKIIVIIDELADLMMVAPGEVEESICRLAQLARAAGIHLVIATQRPSVNVITGVIKANIPSRIAFAVSSQIDSRTILDASGAEKLLGKGDMLYAPQGAGKPTRVQGCFVSDEEVQRIVDFVKEKHVSDYSTEVIEQMESAAEPEKAQDSGPSGGTQEQVDEMLEKAIELAIDAGQVSISMLQRRLRVGYARAGRLVDDMTLMGIVAEAEGPSKPRQTIITREEWKRRQEQGAAE